MTSTVLVRQYDRAAASWTLWIAPVGNHAAYREFARLAFGLLPLPRSVGDLGCGTGDFAVAVLAGVSGTPPALTLVDPSGQMLGRAGAAMTRQGVTAQTHVLTHAFSAGPPRRTSFGYLFTRPQTPKDTAC